MTNNTEPRPKGKGKQWDGLKTTYGPKNCTYSTNDNSAEEEDDWFGQHEQDAARIVAPRNAKGSHNGEQSHQIDRQVAEKKLPAPELSPEDEGLQKSIECQDLMSDVVHDAKNKTAKTRGKKTRTRTLKGRLRCATGKIERQRRLRKRQSQTAAQTQPVAQSQGSVSDVLAQLNINETGQSRGDR